MNHWNAPLECTSPKFNSKIHQIFITNFDDLLTNFTKNRQTFAIFVAYGAETSPNVVGISKTIQKMLSNAENLCKNVKKFTIFQTRDRFELE